MKFDDVLSVVYGMWAIGILSYCVYLLISLRHDAVLEPKSLTRDWTQSKTDPCGPPPGMSIRLPVPKPGPLPSFPLIAIDDVDQDAITERYSSMTGPRRDPRRIASDWRGGVAEYFPLVRYRGNLPR
jgi:hypothetical protein